MRDDIRSIVADLARYHAAKLQWIQKLLLNETDKHHYFTLENYDKIFAILDEDKSILDQVDLIDYTIAQGERIMAEKIGTAPGELYAILDKKTNEVKELLSIRAAIRENVEQLYRKRDELTNKLEGASRSMKQSIETLSDIGRLRLEDIV